MSGIPWAIAALLDMHDMNGYQESMLVAGRIQASNMLFYERDPEQEPPDEISDEEWTSEGEFIHELEPGVSSIVPEGYKLRETNFQHKGDSTGDFQKSVLRGSASAKEVNYNVLANDYEGVSWSSLRQAILEDREHWKRLQGWFISQVVDQIYERWLKNALVSGAIDGLQAYDLDRLLNYKFMGRRWQWVDPLKDEQALGESMSNFTCNPVEALNEKGVDLDQMAEGWQKYLSIMGPVIELAQSMGLGKSKILTNQSKENTTEDDPAEV